jgi:hypothetical protein
MCFLKLENIYLSTSIQLDGHMIISSAWFTNLQAKNIVRFPL